MEVVHDLLGYSNMKIVQNSEWFSFSLDSVLLARFVTVRLRDKEFLDLGCGNAPIPLILSLRTKAHITGVEIQKEVFELAQKSVKLNQKDDQISLLCCNMLDLKEVFDSDTFDVITMNPPYFKWNQDSIINEDVHKRLARHEIAMTLDQVFPVIVKLLKNHGHFAMVQRTERLIEILELLKKYHLEPKKIQFVYPKEGSFSNLFLIEASKNGQTGVKLLPPLYIHHEDGIYREEILSLFEKR